MRLQVPHASVNHVPTLTGGKGHEQLRRFYSESFIPAFPGATIDDCIDCPLTFAETARVHLLLLLQTKPGMQACSISLTRHGTRNVTDTFLQNNLCR